MGKGLSNLQKGILQMAYDGRGRFHNSCRVADVLTAEVYAVLYLGERRDDVSVLGGQHFSMSKIGESEYRSAKAAISRAIRRVEDRGLVTRFRNGHGHGVDITAQGVALIEKGNG